MSRDVKAPVDYDKEIAELDGIIADYKAELKQLKQYRRELLIKKQYLDMDVVLEQILELGLTANEVLELINKGIVDR